LLELVFDLHPKLRPPVEMADSFPRQVLGALRWLAVLIPRRNTPHLNLVISWFENTWGAQVTLTLNIIENSALTPGVSLNTVLPSAVTTFPGKPPPPAELCFSGRGLLSSALLTAFCQCRGFALHCYILA
jgi:hypothetical protein